MTATKPPRLLPAVPLTDLPRSTLGESPVWDDRQQRLLWVDVIAGLLHERRGGEVRTRAIGQHLGAVALTEGPELLLARRDGFAVLTAEAEVHTLAPVLADHPHLRMNDGAVSPDGFFVAGSTSYDGTPAAAALLRLEQGGVTATVLRGLTVSNGLDWTPDGRVAYFADTPTSRIDILDGPTLRRTGVFTEVDGFPDGLCVDAEGGVWVALWGGGQVRRYTPDGSLDVVVEVPTPHTTSCAFAGPALDELVITTAAWPAGPDTMDPPAGCVFTVCTGHRGQPSRRATRW